MRIGVFYSAPYYVRSLESALEAIAGRGHDLIFFGRGDRDGKALRGRLAGMPRVRTAWFERTRQPEVDHAVLLLRMLRDTIRFQEPALRAAHANRARAERRLARALGAQAGRNESLARFSLEPEERVVVTASLAALERELPPDAGIVDAIRRERLDVVFAISRVNVGGGQDDVVRAARAAGIASLLIPYSWDNLTNKGVIHVQPDRLLVWNDVQRREAIELHGVAPERIALVGAARFDPFFALTPSRSREELRAALGLEPSGPVVLYLGSSAFVAPREPEFVERWLAAIRSHAVLAEAGIIIRPHPGALKAGTAWESWRPQDGGKTALVRPDTRAGGQDLLDQIHACDVVVGLNTSAEIEAAIVGRPVLTVRAGELAPGQEGSTHYGYLLGESGGPVKEARSLEEHLDQLVGSIASDEDASARRRAFVASFVRPRGVDRPVGDCIAEEVEALGRRSSRRGRCRPWIRRRIG